MNNILSFEDFLNEGVNDSSKNKSYPKEVTLVPIDKTSEVKEFVLIKTRKKRPGSKTPRYQVTKTIMKNGMVYNDRESGDFYEVANIDFENSTLDSY